MHAVRLTTGNFFGLRHRHVGDSAKVVRSIRMHVDWTREPGAKSARLYVNGQLLTILFEVLHVGASTDIYLANDGTVKG